MITLGYLNKLLMKKIFLTLTFLGAFCLFAKAQLSAGAGVTTTNFGSEFSKASLGVHLRGSYYFREKVAAGLGVSYSLPIKSTYDDGSAKFDRTSSFMSVGVVATFHLIGSYETDFSWYFPFAANYQFGNSKYSIAANQPAGTVAPENEKLSGLTVGLNTGLQYRIGNPYVFVEAGFALAANNTSNTRDGVIGTNPAPSSTVLQLGIRIPFGSGVGGGVY